MKIASMFRWNLVKSVTMGTFAAMVVALATTQVGAAIIATDTVEAHADYTKSGPSFYSIEARDTTGGDFGGLTAQVGDFLISTTSSATGEIAAGVELTAGFGPGVLIDAGTYTISVAVGVNAGSRDPYSTFAPYLEAADGTALPNRNDTAPYVEPAPGTGLGTWLEAVVEYTVPTGDPLIGQEFTWGANFSKDRIGAKFTGIFDDVRVDFEPVPEPASLAMLGLGGLVGIVAMRRRSVA